jgi:hypothetical protein
MTTNPPSDHDGLRHREATRGGGGSEPGEDQTAAELDAIRQRAAPLVAAGPSIIAQALSNDSMRFLESVRQQGGQ